MTTLGASFDVSFSSSQEPSLICGMDEAGRGPLAGPLVGAAVVFPDGFNFAETVAIPFRDSKKLSAHQREKLINYINEFAEVVRVEVITVAEINENGIGWANRHLFERLIMDIDADRYIVDGNLKLDNLGRKAKLAHSVVRADETWQAVSAASIIAKVRRDEIMHQLHAAHPVYGWDHNAGYGTPAHIAALAEYGACEHHRIKFVTTALANYTAKTLPGLIG
jgi:ribonuclease HII